jgi:methionyl-tRNA synthetase
VERGNGELGNAFGNLAQRVLSFIAKNLDGQLPAINGHTEADNALFETVSKAVQQDVPAAFEVLALHSGVEQWLQAVFVCNAYIDEQAPWALRKTDPERMSTVLATLVINIARLAVSISPVIPSSITKLLDTIGVPAEDRTLEAIGGDWYSPLAAAGHRIGTPTPLFPRLELPAEDPA